MTNLSFESMKNLVTTLDKQRFGEKPCDDDKMNIKYSTPGFAGFGKWQATLPEEPHHLYCTNKNGEGLFIQRYGDGDVRQILGAGQFRANNFNHFKSLMRKIRKEGSK